MVSSSITWSPLTTLHVCAASCSFAIPPSVEGLTLCERAFCQRKLEELVVQRLYHRSALCVGHDEGDVGLGCALAHHLHIHVLPAQHPEHLR